MRPELDYKRGCRGRREHSVNVALYNIMTRPSTTPILSHQPFISGRVHSLSLYLQELLN